MSWFSPNNFNIWFFQIIYIKKGKRKNLIYVWGQVYLTSNNIHINIYGYLLFKDNENFHVLSAKWIRDSKEKDVSLFWLKFHIHYYLISYILILLKNSNG